MFFSVPAREKLSIGRMNPKKLAACAIEPIVLALSGRRKPKKRRRVWAKQWLLIRRDEINLSHLLGNEM